MKKGRDQQRNINRKPIHETVFCREKLFYCGGLLNDNIVHIITEIYQNKISYNDGYNAEKRPHSGGFGPRKLFVEKIINNHVSEAENERIHGADEESNPKVPEGLFIVKK
jgi:hypothetical protein